MWKYCWRRKKQGTRFHLLNEDTGKTFCQIENSTAWKNVTIFSEGKPKNRQFCGNCRYLSERGYFEPKPSRYKELQLATLMGERI